MSIHIGNNSTPLAYIDDALAEFISSKGSFPVKLNSGETFDIRVWTEHDAAMQAGMANTYLCIVKLS